MKNQEGFLPQKGNYKSLLSYQKSVIIYDCTYKFCERFFRKYDRTIDQMVQAARSGKQNIIEGSKAAITSSETEIKLTNVARASLEELLEDYNDFLRVKNFELWDKNSKEASYVRRLSAGKIALPEIKNGSYGTNVATLSPKEEKSADSASGDFIGSPKKDFNFTARSAGEPHRAHPSHNSHSSVQ